MIIPDKDIFIKEVEAITDNNDIKQKLIQLYDHAKGYKKCKYTNKIIEEILIYLFNGKLSTEIFIPFSFHKTNIGKIIFSILYNTTEKTYNMQDLIQLTKTKEKPTGYTRQYLGQEISAGRLKGTKKGKVWVFTEDQVNDFLISKGLKNSK